MLIHQDDLLKKPVESVLKEISTLEEQGLTRKTFVVRGATKPDIPGECKQEYKIVNQ